MKSTVASTRISLWRQLSTALSVCALGATAPPAAGPFDAMQYLVGSWSCTYEGGSQRIAYQTKYAFDLGGSWLRQRDSFAGGGSEEETLTFDPKHAVWTAVLIESAGTVTVFRATGSDARHIAYRSVYPDKTITEAFDRLSPTRYMLHFAQSTGKTVVKSIGTCLKT